MRAGLVASRQRLLKGLASFEGMQAPATDGAMYAFFRIARYPDDVALAKALVTEVGLGLAPGSAFGPEGAGYLRWCFAAAPERIDDGLDRFGRFLRGN